MTSEPVIAAKPNATTAVTDAGVRDPEIVSERSVSTLVSGIVADVQHLVEQQLSMIRQEIRDDLRRSKQAVSSLTVPVGLVAAGSCLLLLMLPLLLNWAAPTLPLWACFGIVGALLSAVGGILLFVKIKTIESFDLLSNEAVEAFKENLKWTTKPT